MPKERWRACLIIKEAEDPEKQEHVERKESVIINDPRHAPNGTGL